MASCAVFSEFLADPATEQIHFIGKDIIYFHTLFWPAMLKFAGAPYKVPDNIHVHGFLTVLGAKMSKSRGTGIDPLRYLEIGMDPDWLRYYIARQAQRQRRGRRFQSGGFPRARQQRPGRQVRQHRQPLRRLPHPALRRQAALARTDSPASVLDEFRRDGEAMRARLRAREFGRPCA